MEAISPVRFGFTVSGEETGAARLRVRDGGEETAKLEIWGREREEWVGAYWR